MAKVAVGMEINQRFVSVVQLRRERKGPVLSGFARVALPPGTVTATGVGNPQQLHIAVTGALRAAKAGRLNVCMSVTSELVDVRNLRMPPLPEGELEQAIRWELKQWVGFASGADEDVVLDYAVLDNRDESETRGASWGYVSDDASVRLSGTGTLDGGLEGTAMARSIVPGLAAEVVAAADNAEGAIGSGSMGVGGDGPDVLVVSAPRRFLYEYLTPLHSVRLFPEIVDIAGFSLPWAVPRPAGIGYIHLGPRFAQIMFVEDGAYRLSRQVPLKLIHAVDKVATESIGAVELDAVYENSGPESDEAGKVLRHLIAAINQTVEHFRAQMRAYDVNELIQTLIVSGEGALLPGIVGLIERKTGLSTEAAVPVIGPRSDALPQAEAPAYAVAVGLAQRGLVEL